MGQALAHADEVTMLMMMVRMMMKMMMMVVMMMMLMMMVKVEAGRPERRLAVRGTTLRTAWGSELATAPRISR